MKSLFFGGVHPEGRKELSACVPLAAMALLRGAQELRVAVGLQGGRRGVQKIIFDEDGGTRYPQGAEKQLIQAVTGRQVPSGGLPRDVGCAVFNAATAAPAPWDIPPGTCRSGCTRDGPPPRSGRRTGIPPR